MSERVIITGHSAGLGLALARAWLDCDAQVKGLSRCSAPELSAEYPDSFTETAIDLSLPDKVSSWLQSEECKTFCRGAAQLWLFNNAGTQTPARVLGEQNADEIITAVNLNITAPLLLANGIAAFSGENTAVHIVHISSGAAHRYYPGWSIYGAGKAALNQHANIAAREGSTAVKIAAIAPGVVNTAMQKEIRNNLYFPSRERFLELQEKNLLQDADETAVQIVSYCLSGEFGGESVIDIRDL